MIMVSGTLAHFLGFQFKAAPLHLLTWLSNGADTAANQDHHWCVCIALQIFRNLTLTIKYCH